MSVSLKIFFKTLFEQMPTFSSFSEEYKILKYEITQVWHFEQIIIY